LITDNGDIGKRIRLLRLKQHRTIEEISKDCDFSISLLSKIETGKVFPSVGTLVKVAKALGTNISAFIESDEITDLVYTKYDQARKKMIQTEKGISIYPFATEHKDNHIQPFLHVAKKGEVKSHSDSHEGQEFIFVLKGTLKLQVGSVEYTLNKGDSVYFNSFEEHECTPISDTVEYLDIFA